MSAPASGALREPGAAEDFGVRELTHEDVATWYHVYCTRSHPATRADTFAEDWGDTRFAPILTEAGAPVHTYYAASTPQAAYMESVLHEVPLSPPGLFEVASLAHYHLVQLRLPAPLRYVSFHTLDLPRLAQPGPGRGLRLEGRRRRALPDALQAAVAGAAVRGARGKATGDRATAGRGARAGALAQAA